MAQPVLPARTEPPAPQVRMVPRGLQVQRARPVRLARTEALVQQARTVPWGQQVRRVRKGLPVRTEPQVRRARLADRRAPRVRRAHKVLKGQQAGVPKVRKVLKGLRVHLE